MNIIAMAFVSIGYVVFYWGANQIKHWNRSVTDTEAATMKLLFGFPMDADYKTIHDIPFPYTAGSTAPASSDSSTSKGPKPTLPGNDGANLSPKYPGGSGSTIPTPTIPGVSFA